jgi:hypothetical protein
VLKEAFMVKWRYYPGMRLEGLGKTTKQFGKEIGGPAEIRTVHLQNTSLEGYRSANRFSSLLSLSRAVPVSNFMRLSPSW